MKMSRLMAALNSAISPRKCPCRRQRSGGETGALMAGADVVQLCMPYGMLQLLAPTAHRTASTHQPTHRQGLEHTILEQIFHVSTSGLPLLRAISCLWLQTNVARNRT
jgi:hypothetical protein